MALSQTSPFKISANGYLPFAECLSFREPNAWSPGVEYVILIRPTVTNGFYCETLTVIAYPYRNTNERAASRKTGSEVVASDCRCLLQCSTPHHTSDRRGIQVA